MYTLIKPNRKQGHPYWRVRIALPRDDGSIETKERSTKCKRKPEARAVAERMHAHAAAAASAVTLLEAVSLLLGLRLRQKRSKATISKLEEKSAQLIRFFGEKRDVGGLRLQHTTEYVAHRRAAGVTDSTIAMEMGTLRAALRYLRRLEKYDRDPEALWPDELPHGSGVGERWLPWAEYLLVLAAMPAEFKDWLVLYCATGMRFGELLRVLAADLTEADNEHELRVRGTKTAKDGIKIVFRTVPANPDALEVLQRRAQASPGGPLFPVTRGSQESQKTAWNRALKAACRAARVKTASTNDLRRTFATWARDRGVPEDVVAGWLGHTAKSQMLRKVYVKITSGTHAREGAKLPSRRAKPAKAGEAKEGT